MAQRKFTKALDDFLKEIDTEIFSLKKQLEISKTETKLYKTLLLEEKNVTKETNTLFLLIVNDRNFSESYACIGVFTLESAAIKTIIKGITEFNRRVNDFNVYPIELSESQRDYLFNSDSIESLGNCNEAIVLMQSFEGTSDTESAVIGVKINNETKFLYNETDDFYEEKIIIDQIQEDYLDY